MIAEGALRIAKKEFLDKVRNRWVVVLSLLFAVISLTLAYLGGLQAGGSLGFADFRTTVPALNSVMVVLIPLVALILGYGTIAGEDESGSLGLLLSLAVTRTEVILGKFLGLGAVLLTTVLAGLGVTGAVIAAAAGADGGGGYLAFMGVALLLGLVYLSLALMLSTFAKRRSAAIGGAVFVFFFFAFVFDLIVFGLMVASGWTLDLANPNLAIPDWAWTALLFDPGETAAFGGYLAIGTTQAFGFELEPPDFVGPPLILGVLLAWTLVPLALAFLRFRGRDV